MKPQEGMHMIPIVYANNLNLAVSQWDFRLTFGRVVGVSDDGPEIAQEIIVYMSPQHTKAVSEMLARNVKAYEEQFGSLPNLSESSEPDNDGGD